MKRSAILQRKWPFGVFQPPLGTCVTCDDHLRLIGKRVVDFLLVLIELISLDVTAEVLRAIIDSKSAISLQREPGDPKFQVEGVAPTSHFFLRKLGYSIKISTEFCFVLSIHAFERQTDRRTEFSSLDRVCIPYSVVKLVTTYNLWNVSKNFMASFIEHSLHTHQCHLCCVSEANQPTLYLTD